MSLIKASSLVRFIVAKIRRRSVIIANVDTMIRQATEDIVSVKK